MAKKSKHSLRKLDSMDYLSANAFRDLKTNLEFQLKNQKKQVIIVSSSNQGEGKSYTALNVAKAFAEAKKKVLLIDMDLHRPQTSQTLGIANHPGVSNIYEDKMMTNIIHHVDDNLFAISCGRSTLNSTEILSSGIVNHYIWDQTESFDVVIIDSPPIRLSPDTKTIISNFKNVLFVVRENKTKMNEVEEALSSIKLVSPVLLGMVVNYKKISKKQRKKYGYGYGYGYGYKK
jgi:protein-tyrosine kinase